MYNHFCSLSYVLERRYLRQSITLPYHSTSFFYLIANPYSHFLFISRFLFQMYLSIIPQYCCKSSSFLAYITNSSANTHSYIPLLPLYSDIPHFDILKVFIFLSLISHTIGLIIILFTVFLLLFLISSLNYSIHITYGA